MAEPRVGRKEQSFIAIGEWYYLYVCVHVHSFMIKKRGYWFLECIKNITQYEIRFMEHFVSELMSIFHLRTQTLSCSNWSDFAGNRNFVNLWMFGYVDWHLFSFSVHLWENGRFQFANLLA